MQLRGKRYRREIRRSWCERFRISFEASYALRQGEVESFQWSCRRFVSVQYWFLDSQRMPNMASNPSYVPSLPYRTLDRALRLNTQKEGLQSSYTVLVRVSSDFREKLVSNSFRKNNRARCNRIFAVCWDISSTSAVSLVESCSISRKTRTKR
jgi:hypothetical protein